MKLKRPVLRTGLICIFLAAPLAAYADTPGIYIGGAWGAYSVNEGDLDDNDDMLKAYIGGQFNPWFGIEGSWVDFNRVNNSGGDNFESDGKGLAAVFSFPFSYTSSFQVKGGQLWWNSDSTLGGVVADDDGNDIFFGAGVKLGFTDRLALRLEWERYEVSDAPLYAASIGLQFTF
ncbi:MAG: porin family protein [Gammaproteobacteria bacterium]|nr:porin family protein [Gammaproteobacteria bacterium]